MKQPHKSQPQSPAEPLEERRLRMGTTGQSPYQGAWSASARQLSDSTIEPAFGQGTQQRESDQEFTTFTGPQVDLYDSPDEITLVVDLPGCDPEDVEIEGSRRRLQIVAERPDVDDDKRPLQVERQTRVDRVVALPVEVDIDTASATFNNGVCTVVLPKREPERTRRIEVS